MESFHIVEMQPGMRLIVGPQRAQLLQNHTLYLVNLDELVLEFPSASVRSKRHLLSG